jgi:DNA-binding ferritin-like protein
MFKGFILLFGVGALFAYFVFNFVSDVEKDDPNTVISKDERKAKEFAKYYKTDAVGEWILDFRGAPLSKAKEVWSESPIRSEILENFPQFELMREIIDQKIVESEFRSYLLKKLDDVETEYFSGAIDSTKARKILTDL